MGHWIAVLTSAGKNIGRRLRGMQQVVYAAEDIKRACALGIRGTLITDEGLLWIVNEMKATGEVRGGGEKTFAEPELHDVN